MTWFRILPPRREGWNLEVCELFGFRIQLHLTLLLLLMIPGGVFLYIYLFVAIFLHELAHALVGRKVGYGNGRITIWLLGGYYQTDDDELELLKMTKGERWRFVAMVAAGPIANLALSAIFYCLYLLNGTELCLSFAGLNAILGVGNLLPIPRLDGGQIVRALTIQSGMHS